MEYPLLKPLIFAHRGASAVEPENTLAAFSRAFHDGADGLEFDIRATINREIVIIHDSTVDRTIKNGTGIVKELTLTELRKFDFGHGEKIPTLEEVLKLFGNTYWLNIEIKEKRLEKTLVDMLTDLKITKRLVISSFIPETLRKVKELNASIPTALLFTNPFTSLKKVRKSLHCEGIHPHKSIVTKRLLSRAAQFGLITRTWTVDKPDLAVKLAKMGVQTLITNNPKVLSDTFQALK
ncbi:MAG: glycerophosphodiester phosphodiesterase [Candidatus Heimdallarchaeota archaeon]